MDFKNTNKKLQNLLNQFLNDSEISKNAPAKK